MLRQRLPHSIRNARITLELCEEVENRRSKSGHGNRLLSSGGMAPQDTVTTDEPSSGMTDLSFEGLPFASGLSWALPNDTYASLGGVDTMMGVASSSPGLVFYS